MHTTCREFPKTIEMKLADVPFEMIAGGKKTLEIRLNDEKRRQIQVGDVLVLTRSSRSLDKIKARVVALYPFESFATLFSSALFEKTGCSGMSVGEAVQEMYQYYTKAQEQEFGVLAIEINLIREEL